MPKKSKTGSKASKKGKGKTKEKYKDPSFQYSYGTFTLPNGDVYVGDFCAHKRGLIWREGIGVYFTHDGHTYEGEWKDDKLIENRQLEINYTNGEKYFGSILKDKYSGCGSYILKDKMTVSCKFTDNKPVGSVALIDIFGRLWQGEARLNDAFLLPENEFYHAISETAGVGKLKKKYREVESIENEPELDEFGNVVQPLTDREMEQLVFAKSTKTDAKMDFGESKWCQRYLRFKGMHRKISEKLKSEATTLSEEEVKWQNKYKKYKEGQKWKNAPKPKLSLKSSHTSLLQLYHSKEYQAGSEAMKVFYPGVPEEEMMENFEEERLIGNEVMD